jgi:hypothetical protein
VLLLAGAFEPVDDARAQQVKCDGVLVKPFEPQIVISRVKDLLAGKQPAGMWSSQPAAQGPVRPAAASADADARHAVPPAATGDSLEAYFDHLDAAFGGASEAPPAQRPSNDPIPVSRRPALVPNATPAAAQTPLAPAPSSNDPFADWDPDLHGDPSRPAPVDAPLAFPMRTAVPVQAPPPAPAAPEPRPAAAPAPIQIPSLVEAFTALLTAEQKIGLTPSAATAPPAASAGAPVLTDEVIDAITARVLARLSDESRPAILDVAERLVREEIERIKSIG